MREEHPIAEYFIGFYSSVEKWLEHEQCNMDSEMSEHWQKLLGFFVLFVSIITLKPSVETSVPNIRLASGRKGSREHRSLKITADSESST